MDLISTYWPLLLGLSASGLLSGVLAGLLGIGGGSIIVPILSYTLEAMGFSGNIAQHVAVASSLAIIVPTGLVSARSHYRRGAVDVGVLRLWAPFVLGGTLVGGLMAAWFSGAALRIVFGVVALLIAANTLLPLQQRLMGHLKGSAATHRIAATIVGYVSALMGIGGGSLSVPTMVAFGETMHKAVGTGAAIGVFIAAGGTIGFIISGWGHTALPPLNLGYVNLVAFVLVGGFAALTAPVGAALAHRMKPATLKYVFAGYLALIGISMIWKALAA